MDERNQTTSIGTVAQTISCQSCQQVFEITTEDGVLLGKLGVPTPTFCPDCRLRRRMTWRNERTLYARTCDLCQTNMLSIYSNAIPRTVYCATCWYSDKWDPTSFGVAYDFSRPFFDQYKELLARIPYLNLSLTNGENSDYNNYSLNLRNCYLLFGSWECEDSLYSQRIVRTKDSMDDLWLTGAELVFGTVYGSGLYNVTHSFDVEESRDSGFLTHCRGTSDSFGSMNLRNKSHYLFNQPLTPEAYAAERAKLDSRSYQGLEAIKERVANLEQSLPHPAHQLENVENSSGDFLRNCRNCRSCFLSSEGEDSAYCTLIEKNFRDCSDIWIAMENVERCYELVAGGANNQGSKFGATLYQGCSNLQYCYTCIAAKDSFGCASVRQRQYCILNKQYTKEEYEALVPKIIEQMNQLPYTDQGGRVYRYGEFFPSELSPFAYNETIAQEYFPLKQEEAAVLGYRWVEAEMKVHTVTKSAAELPDRIDEVDASILDEVIGCAHAGECQEQCTVAFKLVPQELEFYIKQQLPLPRLCPNCRHGLRINHRRPVTLFTRQCDCQGALSVQRVAQYTNSSAAHSAHNAGEACPNSFQTLLDPAGPEIVYCESCYAAELI